MKTKINTIKLRNDFLKFFNISACYKSQNFVCKYIADDRNIQIGMILKRKIGCAVKRNKLRRRIKEIAKQFTNHEKMRGMILIICRHKSCSADFTELTNEIDGLFKKINHLSNNDSSINASHVKHFASTNV